jgi:hypothetical protein
VDALIDGDGIACVFDAHMVHRRPTMTVLQPRFATSLSANTVVCHSAETLSFNLSQGTQGTAVLCYSCDVELIAPAIEPYHLTGRHTTSRQGLQAPQHTYESHNAARKVTL